MIEIRRVSKHYGAFKVLDACTTHVTKWLSFADLPVRARAH